MKSPNLNFSLPFLLLLMTLLTACSHSEPRSSKNTKDPEQTDGFDEYVDICEAPCLPVYPGAVGAGTKTKAGRGGQILFVTNLNDSGPGSLRAALSHPEPRIILFKVSGTIEVTDFLYIHNPYVTLAGQSAPGDGILIKGAGLVITTHDVLIQHIRIRTGAEQSITPEDNDAIAILGPTNSSETGAYNVVIDHVSLSWSEDEVISTWFAPHDITISWSIIGEALNRSRHEKVTHSAGLMVGPKSQNVSIHHNFLTSNDFRNPLIVGGGKHEFSYNLVYNWGHLPAEINDTDENTFVNFIGNRYRSGPATQVGDSDATELIFNMSSNPKRPLVYLADNDMPLLNDLLSAITSAIEFLSLDPFLTSPLQNTSSTINDLEDHILLQAGALPKRRDSVDARMVNQYQNGTGDIIDSPADVGGYPQITFVTDTRIDSDNDGMPDTWEESQGLNPLLKDAHSDHNNNHYTNIEEYLHSLE